MGGGIGTERELGWKWELGFELDTRITMRKIRWDRRYQLHGRLLQVLVRCGCLVKRSREGWDA